MELHQGPEGANATEFRNGLLAQLGLTASASDLEIETAYNGLLELLDLAPHQAQSWAAAQLREIGQAYALLSGPAEALTAAMISAATVAEAPTQISQPAAPAATQISQPAAPAATLSPAALKSRRRLMYRVGIPVIAGAIIFGVYTLGGDSGVPDITGTPTNTSAPAEPSTVPVDPVKLAGLMEKISTNPKDIASLRELGSIYFAAGDYESAAIWKQKILNIDPKDQLALLALGAAEFNQGNLAVAKKLWLKAVALYPNVAEGHYNLGFLYLTQDPPDKAKAIAEWNKVIAIDPNSSVAKSVATHLAGLADPSPSPSVSPTSK